MSNNIDHIFYINLDRRVDRKVQMEKQMNEYKLPIERFTAIPSDPGIYGCSRSHLEVLKLAKERNYKNVLILEDDFVFLVSKEEWERQLTTLFESKFSFDVCMVSFIMMQPTQPLRDYSFLCRIVEAQTASGYLVNGAYLDTLIALYEKSVVLLEQTGEIWIYANDQSFKVLQKTDLWVAFTHKTGQPKRLGRQRAGYSDNTKLFQDPPDEVDGLKEQKGLFDPMGLSDQEGSQEVQ